ncbi:hypothetical protein D0Z07_3315 [Hyphodiscus hymeniophilus]|uniref:ASST-domain-containing protein n=1 Tax=Hyphodiscus hymeniophilus TaxID=353542 RepID=A0A9P6VLI5_9HELO|nr:hypothetical protein D0Z07_3315 [Hyphodiscus hymeniophilus]
MALGYILFLLATAISWTRADVDPFFNDSTFDEGAYGPYPQKSYKSVGLWSPRPNILQWDTQCEDGQYTFWTPRGNRVDEAGAMILDSKGDFVWWRGGYGQVYNMQVQEYRGELYLTFWAGDDTVGGHGAGYYYMLDSSYKQVHKLGAANGLDGDLHEFQITPEGTALISVYEVIDGDLTPFGHEKDGKIWDCLIQEIDLATGKLLFQWRASEHYELTETQREVPNPDPFDFFHLNSIDKDLKGNYLISSRFTFTVTYINGVTGDIIWILGGKRNNFTDLSGGKATGFMYQHDARWSDDYTTITIFDNGAEDWHYVEPYTRGIRIKIDQEAMTAELVTEYANPHHIYGMSQGSLQTLPNGNVLMGYGNTGAMTEYAGDGTVLCDVHFGPETWFGSGDIQSYRTYKFNWVGRPDTKPDIAFVRSDDPASNETSVFVSWNGDTEVRRWVLEGTDDVEAGKWSALNEVARKGFESQILMKNITAPYVRARGLDKDGKVLGETDAWNWKEPKVSYSLPISRSSPSTSLNHAF